MRGEKGAAPPACVLCMPATVLIAASAVHRNDDTETKARAWERVFEAFRQEHGREPTVWLDEIVIDQSSLDDEAMMCLLPGDDVSSQHTAKEVIDAGITAIVDLFMQRPDKDTLYYAVNHTEPEGVDRIGLAIFAGAVGEDVRDYITAELKKVPDYVQARR